MDRPKPEIASLKGINADPVEFYRVREADAYMSQLESENRFLETYLEIVVAALQRAEAENQRLRDALRNAVNALHERAVHIGTPHNEYKATYRVDIDDPIKQAWRLLQEDKRIQ